MSFTTRGRRAVPVLVASVLVAGACSGGSDASDAEPDPDPDVAYPGPEWDSVDPSEAGFDQAALDEIAGRAEAAGSNCLVVTRRGRIVGEWYWNGTDASTPQEVFSTTKSITSTLVGQAQAAGDLDVADPAARYIPEWEGTPAEAVTVEDLLSNDSGRQWEFDLDYTQLVGAPDRTAFAVGLDQSYAPGEAWAYNNAAIQTLEGVLEEATGEDVADYAAANLFAPIGMADTEMTRDGAGNPATFFGLQSTCQDLARFGYLFLRGGAWGGEQVVPEDWVAAATGRPSQDLNAAYGYLWWLNRPGSILPEVGVTTAEQAAEMEEGQLVPGAPEDMFWALGLGNQITAVDPGSETVVVRLGGPFPPDGAEPFTTADAADVVTEALTDP